MSLIEIKAITVREREQYQRGYVDGYKKALAEFAERVAAVEWAQPRVYKLECTSAERDALLSIGKDKQ